MRNARLSLFFFLFFYSATPNPSTNATTSVDANGNTSYITIGAVNLPASYDVANRMVSIGYGNTIAYSYAPGNKRVWRGLWTSGSLTTDEVTLWSVSGQKLATYTLSMGTANQACYPNYWQTCFVSTVTASQTGTNYYFGRKLIKNGGGYVGTDGRGSIGKYYPYGQEKPSATTNGTEKFTGYFRDAETGLDYADQRYHNPGTGTFLTPDPYKGSASATDPGSWNLYAYVGGDPVNYRDPFGQEKVAPSGDGSDDGSVGCDDIDPICIVFGGGGIGGGVVGGGICTPGNYFNAESNSCQVAGTSTATPQGCPTYTSPSGTFYVCFHQSGKDWNKFTKNLKTIDKRLQKDPSCEKFLTSTGFSMSQINSDLLNPATTFTLANVITNPTRGPLAGTTNDVGVPTAIIIDSSIYMSSNQATDFLTVLHELAHLVGAIPGEGPGTSSADNDNTVLADCFRTIGVPRGTTIGGNQ